MRKRACTNLCWCNCKEWDAGIGCLGTHRAGAGIHIRSRGDPGSRSPRSAHYVLIYEESTSKNSKAGGIQVSLLLVFPGQAKDYALCPFCEYPLAKMGDFWYGKKM